MTRQHPRVLIVEDDPTIAHCLCKIFSHWHWESATVDSVARAVAAMDSADSGYDLIVVDLILPDGRGTEIVKHHHENPKQAKIVVVTALPVGSVEDVVNMKPDYLLFKPFIFDALESLAAGIYAEFKPKNGPTK